MSLADFYRPRLASANVVSSKVVAVNCVIQSKMLTLTLLTPIKRALLTICDLRYILMFQLILVPFSRVKSELAQCSKYLALVKEKS